MRLGLLVCLAAVFAVGCGEQTPASLEFVDIAPAQPRLGDIATVRFKAIDSRGNAQAGVTVNFALQDTGAAGVSLNPTTATTNKNDGIASTQLVVTGRVTSVVVVASSGDKIALTPPIGFAGAAPNAEQFTFQCGPLDGASSGGIHAIRVYDQARHMNAGVKLKCTAHVADRNGDGVPNAQVSFLTEAGAIGPTETTKTDVVGNADVLYKSSDPLPEDVDPGQYPLNGGPLNDQTHTGEPLVPLWMKPYTWSKSPIADFIAGNPADGMEPQRIDPERVLPDGGPIVMNPRDNLVTMIAVTAGEEAFIDTNNNGVWDNGEPFTDTTEPFVDNNDNGTWDPGERYLDTNGNGKWDGKNGKFDPNTLIWTEERILWTGLPDGPDAFDNPPLSPAVVFSSVSNGVNPGSTNIPNQGALTGKFVFSDPWWNGLTRDGNGDACSTVENGPILATVGGTGAGIKEDYPPIEEIDFVFADNRDPDAGVLPYSAQVLCKFTDSPEGGAVVSFPASPLLTGEVGIP